MNAKSERIAVDQWKELWDNLLQVKDGIYSKVKMVFNFIYDHKIDEHINVENAIMKEYFTACDDHAKLKNIGKKCIKSFLKMAKGLELNLQVVLLGIVPDNQNEKYYSCLRYLLTITRINLAQYWKITYRWY